MKLFRPVKGIRNVDRRLTQGRGTNPEMYKPIGRPYHLGLDYAGPNPGDLQDVFSVEDGVVIRSGLDRTGFGQLIVIEGESGRSFYAHLSTRLVRVGEKVSAMQRIGVSGKTGNSTGVHLHYGRQPKDPKLIVWGKWGNPTSLITDRPQRDSLVQRLVSEGYWNGIEGDGITERVALLVAKAKYT